MDINWRGKNAVTDKVRGPLSNPMSNLLASMMTLVCDLANDLDVFIV
jgi:hypothetical protein